MTLLDSNVLIYAAEHGSPHHDWARRTIVDAVSTDGAAINRRRLPRHRVRAA